MEITHFKNSAAFRRWLERNHKRATEIWVGFYRKSSGRGGLTYKEALDQALCFGWIDGIRKRVDDASYMQRFTPRTARSVWSLVNIRRVGELTKLGLMTPHGIKVFEARDPARCGIYSFENRPKKLTPELERRFRNDRAAWEYFVAQPPGYRRLAIWFVMSAKKEETRLKRLAVLMDDSAHGRRLGVMQPARKP
jgi:uncharacterized protein YdeI (YjbR/CyaY-like superfamily)